MNETNMNNHQGLGKNGVVFQTTRPDDSEAFANRYRDQMTRNS
jgi:hypothetical protein